MKISRATAKVEVGHGIGNEIEERLKNAKERVYVISPWISSKYAENLHRLSKNIDVKLIIAENEDNLESIERIVKKQFVMRDFVFNGVLFVLSFIFSLYVLVLFHSIGSFILLVVSLMLFAASLLFLVNLRDAFRVEVPFEIVIQDKKDAHFLHLKAYLVDDSLYLCSANFTESGFKRNIEHWVRFEDRHVVEEFLRYFMKVKGDIKTISVEDFIKKYAVRTKLLKIFS